MADNTRYDSLRKKGERTKEELDGKSLKLAYEIVEEIERTTNIKLSFEHFNFILKKVNPATNEGFFSGTSLMYSAGVYIFHNH